MREVDGTYVLTGRRQRRSFGRAVVTLILHLVGAGILFVAVFAIGWVISIVLDYMNSAHPFDPEVWRLRARAEVWLTYIDIATSGVVVLVGALRFLREMMR